MHMADALLSPLVGGTMAAVSAGAVGYAAHRLKQEQFSAHSVPLMGVMGAFVFAAQMVNFTIPGTGSSGHIGGGILLSAVLGGPAALLTLTAVLIIQCLFFADGGLLALGCNIFNMGVLPCLLVYPLVFAPLTKKGFTKGRLAAASIAAAVLALQLGAFAVVLETLASGITALPFSLFVLAMQPIHLAIGLVEGVVTGAVLYFVNGMEPDILRAAREHRAAGADAGKAGRRRWAATLCVLLVCAGLTAGGLSLLASQNPDGLEWSIARVMGSTELAPGENAVHGAAAAVQDATAILPDSAACGTCFPCRAHSGLALMAFCSFSWKVLNTAMSGLSRSKTTCSCTGAGLLFFSAPGSGVNPATLLYLVAAAFVIGLSSGAGGAWWVQGLRLDAVQAFVATTKAQGEAAKKLADATAAEDKRKKESSDHDYQTTIAGLNADIKRMRDDRARSRFVPAAPAGSRSVGLACFDRADLERTLQQFDEAVTGLIAEGDADAVGLNVARSWAQGAAKLK